MSEINYFPRYSQRENAVTNNTLLLMLRLNQYNRFKFERFMGLLCPEEEVQLANSWLQFRQQKGTGKSIVDGFIAQDSIKIAVETKLTESFNSAQLENHLNIFGAEQHKVLILLSPVLGPSAKSQLSLVSKSAVSKNIQVIHTSFEDIIEKVRRCLSEHDEEMCALVDDYEAFCSETDLLPTDKRRLFAPPCGKSFEANKQFQLYYCKATSSRRKARYLGIYARMSIRAIGQVAKVVDCTVDTDAGTVAVLNGQETLTRNEQERIIKATNEARSRDWDLTVGHRFYLCEKLYETDFKKTSPNGIWGHRYFDLEEVLKGKVPQDVSTLAELLRQHSWG